MNCYKFRLPGRPVARCAIYHAVTMKLLVACLLVIAAWPALAQPGPGRAAHGNHGQREFGRPMPPPERRMSWEDRQRLREQVRSGQMTRDEARERWREERARRASEPGRSGPEDRERLRRDVLEANRDLERR